MTAKPTISARELMDDATSRYVYRDEYEGVDEAPIWHRVLLVNAGHDTRPCARRAVCDLLFWIRGQESTANRVFSSGARRPPFFEELAAQQGVTPIDDFETDA